MGTEIGTDTSSAFDVFISYASVDHEPVELLVQKLKIDGYRVWFAPEQIVTGPPTLGQLVDGIANSSHMIVCLSDAYIEREFTVFELQTNLSFDPTNKSNRTIPVKIRPLSRPVPAFIQAFRYGDLTDSSKYDTEFARITSGIHRAKPSQIKPTLLDQKSLEQSCKAPFDDLDKPNVALFQTRLAVEVICKFLHRQEVGELSHNFTFDVLVERILSTKKLPEHVKMSLSIAQKYGDFVVRDRMENYIITKESIQPGLAALKVLADWTFTEYFQVAKKDPWDAIWDKLPVENAHNERAIPGSKYKILKPDKPSLNSLGPLYAGCNVEWNQAVAVNLVNLSEENDSTFFEEVSKFMRLNDANIIRPLDARKLVVNSERLCLYVVLEHFDGASGQDLIERFGKLPAFAVCELCRGMAVSLEGLHSATPQIIHGDIKPANVIVGRYGTVKLLCIGRNTAVTAEDASSGAAMGKIDSFLFSSPEQLSGAKELTPKADLFALHATLSYLLTGEYGARPGTNESTTLLPPVVDALEKLALCATVAEARKVLDLACQQLAEKGVNLRTVIDCYREKTELPELSPKKDEKRKDQKQNQSLSPKPKGFSLVAELSIESRGAWPFEDGSVLIWEAGADTLTILKDSELLWRDSYPLRLRSISHGPENQLAAASWDGHVRCFDRGLHTASVKLDGTIGDIQFCIDRWIAGTWKHSLVGVTSNGNIIPIFDVEKGIFRIAVMDHGDHFAAADLGSSISIFSGERRIAETTPLGGISSMAFAGKRLMLVSGECLIAIDLSGNEVAREKVGNARLMPSPSLGHCLLLDDKGTSWEIDEAGRHIPYFSFLPEKALLSSCKIAKSFTLASRQGGCAYWRHDKQQQAWPDAMTAMLSQDGQFVAVTFPGKVQLYRDPL
ncbi:MAG: TIR domain-containing protein [Planctomycetes bacterium]|nr:TIR domain-containing protein [Planctomycetota bacterium]